MGRKVRVAIDLGCYEFKGIVFEIVDFKDTIHVLAAKKEAAGGLDDGKIVNATALKKQLSNMLTALSDEAGVEIEEIYLAIPPSNAYQNNMVKSAVVADSSGSVSLTNLHVSELTERILNEIKRKSENEKYTLIDFFVNEYSFAPDSKSPLQIIEKPEGVSAYSLGIDVFFVMGLNYVISTLEQIFEDLYVFCDKITVPFVPGGFKAVPYKARKEGALYIDMGSSFTNAVIFKNDSVIHSYSLPIGGNTITTDLIRAFGKTLDDENFQLSEKIKKKNSNLIIEAEDSRRNIYMDRDLLSDCFLTVEQVKLIMRERVEEILNLVKEEIKRNPSIDAGAYDFEQVILSGGTAKFIGIDEVARGIFNKPVKVATPYIDSGVSIEELNSPEYVSVYGLAEYFASGMRKPSLNSGFLQRLKGKLRTIFNKRRGDV